MNCQAAENWLLVSRSPDELPERVRRHLTDCPRCEGLLARLTRLDQVAMRLTPPANPTARTRLDAAVAQTPQEPSPPREPVLPYSRPTRRPVPRWVIGLAAALLVAGSWVGGRLSSPKFVAQAPLHESLEYPQNPPHMILGLPVAPHPAPAPTLVAKVSRHAANMTADPTPVAQLEALEKLAGDVRAEAMKRASTGDLDHIPRLVGLYERILKLGVARQLTRVPDHLRTSTTSRVADALNQSADEVAALAARLLPVAGDHLQSVVASCREIGTAFRQGKTIVPPSDWPSPATTLESLVAQTIRVANVTDPLARADESTQLAAALAQAITVLSVAGLDEDAVRVGEAMDDVFDFGVAANLDRITATDPAGKLRKEVSEVRERAGRTTEVLERNLAKAPPAARGGLERALEASDPGRAKATGKASEKRTGKGPPWKKGEGDHPGKGGTPPGWLKKL